MKDNKGVKAMEKMLRTVDMCVALRPCVDALLGAMLIAVCSRGARMRNRKAFLFFQVST